jgi:DNA helicase HerA-like ATPase
VDQRPAKIDDEVRSQLANRLILSLKEPSDLASALAGVPDRSVWESIVATIPARTVAMVGDAIRIPTVIDIMNYTPENVRENILDGGNMTSEDMDMIAQKVDKVFSF